MVEKLSKNLIGIAIVIAGTLIAIALVFINQRKTPSLEILPPQQAGERAINFINENLLSEGLTSSLVSITEESGIYKLQLKIGEQEYTSYLTKDGKLFFPEGGISLESVSAQFSKKGTTVEIPKRDRPDVKLFVMSYCPFGLQAQKMFLPVYNLLKEKAEMGVYFVNYIMHGKKEIDENLRQYCIQKEEKEKYYHYLSCFVKDGNFEKCLKEAQIDKEKMASCISQTDQEYEITKLYNDKNSWLNGQFPKFNIHNELNEKYGVRGSPTIVINDQIVEVSPRSPEKFKEVICQSFNSPPSECSQRLSETPLAPGFGLETGGGGGQCK